MYTAAKLKKISKKKFVHKFGYLKAVNIAAFFGHRMNAVWDGQFTDSSFLRAVDKFSKSSLVADELSNMMFQHGSDKALSHHNYTAFYNVLFQQFKSKKPTIFEMGIGTNNPDLPSTMGVNGKPGASLWGWSDYFPGSPIFAADIDKNILFSTQNIKCFHCDQTSVGSIQNLWVNPALKNTSFDILIDDGLHEYDAGVIFFENSINKVNPQGYYVIEDVGSDTIVNWQSYFASNLKKFGISEYAIVTLSHPYNAYDNRLVVMRKS
jgi:hypothetical protein